MIAEFTVENYRSFKGKHTFSLISTKDRELAETNTFLLDKELSFLKTAIIYGANASGKSNFFSALHFFLSFSNDSGPAKQIGDPIEIEPFVLSKQTETAPSSFEIVFFLKEGSTVTRYRYGLTVNNKQVVLEYLFAVNNVREITLFTRKFQEINYTFRDGYTVLVRFPNK